MRRIFAASLALLLLAGCASRIMEGYIGKPVSEFMLDHGSPADAFDLDLETRAFVWTKEASITTPGTASTSGTSYSTGYFSATTTYDPPQTTTIECQYVLLAKRNGSLVEGPASWTIVGFRKPKLICE